MGYKTICVMVTDSKSDGPALSAAAALALRLEAHLDVYCIGVDPVMYEGIGMGIGVTVLEGARQLAKDQSEALAVWVRNALPMELTRQAVCPMVLQQLGLDSELIRFGRYSDLMVAAKPYGEGHNLLQVAVFEAAAFGAGLPVLVVPDSGADLAAPLSRIMIGWNDTAEAFSAVRKALPLLKAAKHVDVVIIDPPIHSPDRSDPGGSISLLLARHGVKAEVSILSRSLPDIADVLLRFAHEHGVNAIVMGAYGHSRLREAILGGATRDILESADLPLIMAR